MPPVDAIEAALAARAFYEAYAAKRGKPRWGEKTPQYVKTMGKIGSILPEARFIHLIRDGRAVALSLMEVSWGPSTVAEAAELWVELIGSARRKARRLPHYVELRYEDLVADPERAARIACDLVDLEFEPAMLDYHAAAGERMSAVARDFQIGGARGLGRGARAPALPGLCTPSGGPRRALARGDDAGRRGELRGGRRRDAR